MMNESLDNRQSMDGELASDPKVAVTTATSSSCAGNITPIRPRPILASLSYSLDSGYEVSPICLASFRYGDSVPSQLDQSATSDSIAANNTVDEGLDVDDMEGFDEELISIDHHFTPINSSSSITNLNLAELRRQNQIGRQMEINNNDIFFPDLNSSNATDAASYSVFELDDEDEEDDDVFIDSYAESDQDEMDFEQHYKSSGSSASIRSSSPIPIPGAEERLKKPENFFSFSVPNGCRMPYYHKMAPPLVRPEVGRRAFRSLDFQSGMEITTTTSIADLNKSNESPQQPPLDRSNGSNSASSSQESTKCSTLITDFSRLDLVPQFERRLIDWQAAEARVHRLKQPMAPHLPDVIATTGGGNACRRTSSFCGVHNRNSLFTKVPYPHNSQQLGWTTNGARRTMSVSLPIDHDAIVTIGSGLRQISDEFSSSFQIQRINPIQAGSALLTFMQLLVTYYQQQRQQQQQSRRAVPRSRVVDNSTFYIGSPSFDQTTTTTGNSTFYVPTRQEDPKPDSFP